MNFTIVTTTEQEMNELLEKRKLIAEQTGLKGGKMSSLSHLKSSLFDWRLEQGWDPKNKDYRNVLVAKDENGEIAGGTFFSYSKREPKITSFRHIFLFEEYRGNGLAEALYNERYKMSIAAGCTLIRLFANIPAYDWHLNVGMRFFGMSKTKLPFGFVPILPGADTMKELGRRLDDMGPDKVKELIRPALMKQMAAVEKKGGRWMTQEELDYCWKKDRN
jgi:GNAT superfamily N-acetyltransferase